MSGGSYVVTGGCGFIGSEVVRGLLRAGASRVTVVDSLEYGQVENLAEVARDVEIVKFKLGADPIEGLAAHLRSGDRLFHLAAEKHNQSKDSPAWVLQANVDATYALLALAAERGVARTVFSSSLYAYGRMQGRAMSEDDVPAPHTVYGISKLAGEHLLQFVARTTAMEAVVLRYFFVYGPRQYAHLGYKSVIVKNFERLLAGEPPLVHGDGEQALDYTYVSDVADVTRLAMERAPSGAVLNVGSGAALSVNDLTRKMLAVAGSTQAPVHGPPDWTAGSRRFARVEKLAQALGWTPRIALPDGLRSTYEWMKKELAR